MGKINVAVFGSCVTRDVFNSKFNKDYKKYYECILTQNQTSIISLMSKPIPFVENKVDNINEYDTWNIRTEFTKEFLPLLIEKSPNIIILDFFADVHLGVLKLDSERYITNNRWKLWKTTYYKELKKNVLIIDMNIGEYLDIWIRNIEKFFEYIAENLPNTKVIINKFKFVDQYISNENSEIRQLSTSGKALKIDVELSNFLLDHLNNHVIDNYNIEYIDMTKKEYMSYEGHPWGPFYVHYTSDYYEDVLKELNNKIGVT
ncbi:DUF6270 domain-containing protein [Psychrobacillus sp. OK032]|uniref:DUF6270 domain-containing protein n=1 Tax=Psychrobacillus sp. OK032 TaxID=1884358 RepID=UPI0008D026F4|nr:DUF6270 domain-containing protein [Psychrobacillus sp. OK032]SER65265.1 hypothetical protein SAMN05518872_101497 [Psychrobacillus sp. OK032]